VGNEPVVYSTFCPTARSNGDCNGREQRAGRESFRTNSDRQFVVNWTEDGEPSRYDNCAVLDAQNWPYPLAKDVLEDPSIRSMNPGRLNGENLGHSVFHQVSPEWWYILKVHDRLTGQQR
jgi:hypothetical protein